MSMEVWGGGEPEGRESPANYNRRWVKYLNLKRKGLRLGTALAGVTDLQWQRRFRQRWSEKIRRADGYDITRVLASGL